MLGHSKISTTLDVYSHVSLDLQRQDDGKTQRGTDRREMILGCRQVVVNR